MSSVTVIGAGLAGSEAAWQAAEHGADVTLYEMRPKKTTPAHQSGDFAELVCSNSLRAASLTNAVGVLKEEMRRLNSVVMSAADANAVPAGGALAVDRVGFGRYITEKVTNHPRINVLREEITTIPTEGVTIIATGPLTAGDMAREIVALTGEDGFYFYDAAAPIVTRESIDMEKAYFASRYDKGEAAYLNCPMTEDEYNLFWQELTHAAVVPIKEFEDEKFFEGCMPVEVMAGRGKDTLRFGPLKPVGLVNPATGELPYAVVQLRQDDAAATLYNIVGFQTHLTWGEQRRVFSLIPGLEKAEFARYGVMHRNTFINSPKLLLPTLQLKKQPRLFFAGQMIGVEGYVESAAAGLAAGRNAARLLFGDKPLVFPMETCTGALCRYVTEADEKNFQPMNITFGLLPPLEGRVHGKTRKKELMAERALTAINNMKG